LVLLRRNSLDIIIDESGIEIPAFNLLRRSRRILIPRQEIAEGSKLETITGRLIEIRTRSGERVSVQARHYCSLEQFLSHCRKYGLPVVCALAGVLLFGATMKSQSAGKGKTLDITVQVLDGRNGKPLADQHVLVFTGMSINAVKSHTAHTGLTTDKNGV